jgi:hypothetical protein
MYTWGILQQLTVHHAGAVACAPHGLEPVSIAYLNVYLVWEHT